MEHSAIYLRRVGTNEDVDAGLWDDITDLSRKEGFHGRVGAITKTENLESR